MSEKPIIEDEDWSESSEDEIEDEEGELVTDRIEEGIQKVLQAIRNDDPALKDKNAKFFPEIGEEGVEEKERHKPVYLKDYQREQILESAKGANKSAAETSKPHESYADEQERLRQELIKEAATVDGSDGDDDDLLKKREGPDRELPEVSLPDPEKDADGFLNSFISQKAWLPSKNAKALPTYAQVTGDEDKDAEDEFDEKSEKFETAYNFRFEDPEAAEIVSYARDQNTLRRGKLSSRQKKREREQKAREQEEQQRKLELAKMRKKKVGEVADKLAQLQEALGAGEAKVAELLSQQDLDGDFDDAEWDRRMQKLFDDEFYNRDSGAVGGEDLGEEIGEEIGNEEEAAAPPAEPPVAPLSRKDLKRKAEKFVEENEDLLLDKTIKPTGFRYREVEPENFGLSARDILLASDKDLNQFVGIKKLASYRDRQKAEHDRKKYAKRKRLRQWRKEVFGTEDAPGDDMWEKAKAEAAAEAAEAASTAPPARKRKAKSKSKHK